VTGAVALAEFAHVVAEKYPVQVALHTDHCPKDKLDGYVRPLLDVSAERVAKGLNPLFQSHMWDGSAETLADNLAIGQELLAKAAAAKIILEVEITPTGGEEDGVSHEINDELYTTVNDAVRTAEALGLGEQGRYLLAASFGNVHGVYKPGNVVLRPDLLKELNDGVAAKYGQAAGAQPFDFVFHGGSGSSAEEIATALENGVVKMNLDTDTQYAFTRPVVDHVFRNYDGVLKVDGEVGNKKAYDPRAWGKAGEAGMAARVVEACENLRSTGHSIG
jgi:fructose-bisphosphate aldolase class II